MEPQGAGEIPNIPAPVHTALVAVVGVHAIGLGQGQVRTDL
jgi:hypothetical protein